MKLLLSCFLTFSVIEITKIKYELNKVFKLSSVSANLTRSGAMYGYIYNELMQRFPSCGARPLRGAPSSSNGGAYICFQIEK